MNLALGIDIGTSGVRTAVLDACGELLCMAAHPHQPQNPTCIDAEKWWETVLACLTDQITALRDLGHDPMQIASIAVDGTSGTMVLTNARLQTVTRALMYDSKGFEAEAALIDPLAPDLHITKGPASALGRALRLQSEDTDKSARHLLHQADFITSRLIGRVAPSDYNNALKTGFDPETETWPVWISKTGFATSLLPEVVAPGAEITSISARLADELGLSRRTRIHAGTTDSIAAFLACADPMPGVAVTSIGTTLAIKILSQQRIDDPATGLYSHRLGDHWLVGGASNTGGGVLKHYFSDEELITLSQNIDPEIDTGLEYYPLLSAGERFPINDPKLEPRLSPRPENDVEFLHGLFEGIARIEGLCYQRITQAGGTMPHKIFTAGGAARNSVFTRIRSRYLPVPPTTAKHTEAAIGAAKLASIA
ncbi:FGGY-family carbohydrate kinase [Oceaniglobus ichthyenteri]|uniref:FGGY-family carbohydrate kinase n=1 Tax=Oceaniglobus ichthyenteri TaxID=2136177 RepID=UPI000D354920|nr:FGGY-family carbohydrate kinase [Oceaniglobus ichthyenteri]